MAGGLVGWWLFSMSGLRCFFPVSHQLNLALHANRRAAESVVGGSERVITMLRVIPHHVSDNLEMEEYLRSLE